MSEVGSQKMVGQRTMAADLFESVADKTEKSINILADDLDKIELEQNDADRNAQQITRSIQSQQPLSTPNLQQLNQKEHNLLQQLKKIRETKNTIISQQTISYQQPNNENPQVSSKKTKKPQRKTNKQRNRPNLEPKLSREQFEKIVMEMANNIRSRVKKTEQLHGHSNRFDYKTNIYIRKRQSEPLKLPKIQKRDNLKNMDQEKADNPVASQTTIIDIQLKRTSIAEKISKIILKELLAKVQAKIVYNQKYGIKLDPIKHTYPISSFRKKILEESKLRKRQKKMSESLRVSMLSRRKQILEASRKSNSIRKSVVMD